MSRIINYDSPLISTISKLGDLLILNLLWLICCIPIVTIGPATTAMYYVTLKMARKEEPSVFKCFFHSFKQNFVQGILMFLLLLFMGAVLIADILVIGAVTTGTLETIARVILFIWSVAYFMVFTYSFPLLAQFDNTTFNTLKNALLLSVHHLPSSILILFLHALPVVCFLLSIELFLKTLPLWLFLAPVAIARLCTDRHKKIFTPLMPPDASQDEETGSTADE